MASRSRRNEAEIPGVNPIVLGIDFDMTICDSQYPECGPEMKGAKKYINKLYNEGYAIVVNTCRTQEAEGRATRWLNEHGFKYDYLNCNVPWRIEYFGMDCRKISADVYVDDKQIGGLPSWKEIYKWIRANHPIVDDCLTNFPDAC